MGQTCPSFWLPLLHLLHAPCELRAVWEKALLSAVLARKDFGGTLDNLLTWSQQWHRSKDNYIEISARILGKTPDLHNSVRHTWDKEKSVAYYYYPLSKVNRCYNPLNFLIKAAAFLILTCQAAYFKPDDSKLFKSLYTVIIIKYTLSLSFRSPLYY
jgi:hypothetical protein